MPRAQGATVTAEHQPLEQTIWLVCFAEAKQRRLAARLVRAHAAVSGEDGFGLLKLAFTDNGQVLAFHPIGSMLKFTQVSPVGQQLVDQAPEAKLKKQTRVIGLPARYLPSWVVQLLVV